MTCCDDDLEYIIDKIVTCCDDDLEYIIDKKVNLLQYMGYKIFRVTSNSPTATYEMFNKDLRVEDL